LDRNAGICGARYVADGKLWTRAFGAGTSPVADPVEKKPLYHFLPGTKVLSFGTLGCNLKCSFCQNWSLSASHNYEALQSLSPDKCVQLAIELGCSAIAFTYNEPIISSEFCIDVSNAAHDAGLRSIAVSNGYVLAEARSELFDAVDATNVDLKGICPKFYAKYCGGRVEPVLETLTYLVRSARTWVEITNLIIPGLNDSSKDIDALIDWICTNVGLDVPLHFSAFHPAYRIQSLPRTPTSTLSKAKEKALACGLQYVYIGNVSQPQDTICPRCKNVAIQRLNHAVTKYQIQNGKCSHCGCAIAGIY
jgi:pyruvate formate lyase activating enzyme